MAVLEEAIVVAKEANVGIGRAKRLAKEMTAHFAAAEATRQLDAAMRGARPAAVGCGTLGGEGGGGGSAAAALSGGARPAAAGSGALRAALARAETAAAALGGGGGGVAAEGVAALSLASLNEVLVPLMQVSL